MDSKPKILPQIVTGLIASFGGFLIGNVIGWSSPSQKMLVQLTNITEVEFSAVSSVMTVGAAFSQIITYFLMEILGIKISIVIMSFLTAIAWVIITVSQNFYVLLVGRFLQGLFAGGMCVLSPSFISEMAHKSLRGGLGVCFQLMITVGILVSFIFAYIENLYIFHGVCATISLILGILFLTRRETPIFLLKKKDTEKAKRSLLFYRSGGSQTENHNVDDEFAELQALTRRDEDQVKLRIAIKEKACIKATLIVTGMTIIQQLSGINIVMFYAHFLFTMTDSNMSSRLSALIIGIVQVFMTFIAAAVVDRIGRKILWYISLSIMCICLLILGAYFTFLKTGLDSVKSIGLLPTVVVCLYICGFSLGAGPLTWSMMGEMLLTRVKPIIMTSVAFLNWMLAYLITSTFFWLVNTFGADLVFYFYGIICAIGIIFIAFGVFETKNKSLEEIQKKLHGES